MPELLTFISNLKSNLWRKTYFCPWISDFRATRVHQIFITEGPHPRLVIFPGYWMKTKPHCRLVQRIEPLTLLDTHALLHRERVIKGDPISTFDIFGHVGDRLTPFTGPSLLLNQIWKVLSSVIDITITGVYNNVWNYGFNDGIYGLESVS